MAKPFYLSRYKISVNFPGKDELYELHSFMYFTPTYPYAHQCKRTELTCFTHEQGVIKVDNNLRKTAKYYFSNNLILISKFKHILPLPIDR